MTVDSMSSYAPSYYGLNSFYPSSYTPYYGYGAGYDNLCNRYANGVVYRVDCMRSWSRSGAGSLRSCFSTRSPRILIPGGVPRFSPG